MHIKESQGPESVVKEIRRQTQRRFRVGTVVMKYEPEEWSSDTSALIG